MRFNKLRPANTAARAVTRATNNLLPVAAGRIAGRAPGTVLRSVLEHSHRPEVARHIESLKEARPARIEKYPHDPDLPSYFRRQKAFDPVYTYRLKDVVVSPSSGMVWLEEEGLVLLESVGSLYRLLGWEQMLWQTRLSPRKGPTEAIALPTTGYYHWLLEIVPSFLTSLAEASHDATVVIPPKRIGATDCLLGHAQVPASRISEFERPLRVERLILTGIPDVSGFVGMPEIETLRSWHRHSLEPDVVTSGKVYISRSQAAKRSIANEKELEEALSQRGYDIVHAEGLTLLEQAEIFRRASVVVSPHGAGLSNLVWRSGSCRVVEIFPAAVRNDCFARLAALLGFDYSYVVCATDSDSAGRVDVSMVLDQLPPDSES